MSRAVPSSFVPVEDQGYFFIVVQLPDGASLARTEQVVKQVRGIAMERPEVDDVVAITGLNFLTNSQQSNSAAAFAILKPWAERPGKQHSAQAIVAALKPRLLGLPDAIALSFDPPSIPGLGTTGGLEFEVEDLTGKGARALDAATQALMAEARKQPELDARQLLTTSGTATPELDFKLDRVEAKDLGLNLADVFTTMQVYLGSLCVNDFNLFGRTFHVTAQAAGRRPPAPPACRWSRRTLPRRPRRSEATTPAFDRATRPWSNQSCPAGEQAMSSASASRPTIFGKTMAALTGRRASIGNARESSADARSQLHPGRHSAVRRRFEVAGVQKYNWRT